LISGLYWQWNVIISDVVDVKQSVLMFCISYGRWQKSQVDVTSHKAMYSIL